MTPFSQLQKTDEEMTLTLIQLLVSLIKQRREMLDNERVFDIWSCLTSLSVSDDSVLCDALWAIIEASDSSLLTRLLDHASQIQV